MSLYMHQKKERMKFKMKKIVIAGGGIAGLSAGIFAQKNGYESMILEKNTNIGGECTGWDRRGYHIDGCIHWLVGTKKGTQLRKLWDLTGALDGVEIYEPESFLAVEYENTTVHFYKDLDRLEKSWLEISSRDENIITEVCDDIRRLWSFEIPAEKPFDMMSLSEKAKHFIKMGKAGPVLQKYSKLSVSDLANKFSHPALRTAISSFMPDGDYCAYSVIFPLSVFTSDQASIPYGGSKALAERMKDKYISLGGHIKTSFEVTEALIEKGSVTGVIAKSGELIKADHFIAACDPSVLYGKLLKGRYADNAYLKRFNDDKSYPLASNIYIGIGYQGTFMDIPRTLRFQVDGIGITQDEKSLSYLQLTHYAYEPDFAPSGCTVLTIAINQFKTEIDRWFKLSSDKEAYKSEKQRIGEEVIKAVGSRFPHMKGKLQLLDVATPYTYHRYCNAYRGAFMSFLPTVGSKMLNHTGEIKGLSNIYLSGQWLQPPGGLPVAVITGRDTIMRICKKDGTTFVQ